MVNTWMRLRKNSAWKIQQMSGPKIAFWKICMCTYAGFMALKDLKQALMNAN
jgi:hypothetical protein